MTNKSDCLTFTILASGKEQLGLEGCVVFFSSLALLHLSIHLHAHIIPKRKLNNLAALKFYQKYRTMKGIPFLSVRVKLHTYH